MIFWYAITFVQIVAESFPVSSSGHVRLLELILVRLGTILPAYQVREAFDYVLHAPTIMLMMLFGKRYWIMIKPYIQRFKDLFLTIVYADTVTIGFYCLVRTSKHLFPLPLGFVLTACVLFSLYWCPKSEQVHDQTLLSSSKYALLLGLVQGIALFPGISRFGATYVCARWMGYSGVGALIISWAIQLPLLFLGVAKGLWMMSGVMHSGEMTEMLLLNPSLLFTMVISCSIAWYGMRTMMMMAQNYCLWIMGVYMLIPITIWIILELL